MKQDKHQSGNPDRPVLDADELARTMATQGGAYGGVNHQDGGEPEGIERLDPASHGAADQAGGPAASAGQAGGTAQAGGAAEAGAAAQSGNAAQSGASGAASVDRATPSPSVTPQAAEAAELGRS